MKTQQMQTLYPFLSVNPGSETYIQMLTDNAWIITYTAIWNGTSIEQPEVQKTKKFIRSFLERSGSYERQYEEFVQRVLVERFIRARKDGYTKPSVSEWLIENSDNGFGATASWYKDIIKKRSIRGSYRDHWFDFSWAVFHSGPRKPLTFHRWRNYLGYTSQPILNLYLACMANKKRLGKKNESSHKVMYSIYSK